MHLQLCSSVYYEERLLHNYVKCCGLYIKKTRLFYLM